MKSGIPKRFARLSSRLLVAALPATATLMVSACGSGSTPPAAAAPPPTPTAVWDNPAGTSGIVALAVSGSGGAIYLGGTFTSVAGTARSHLAAVDVTTGALLAWDPNIATYISNPPYPSLPTNIGALVVVNGVVFAGGSFTSVGGASHDSFVAIDATSGSALPWNLDAVANGYLGTVDALAVCGNTVYVGGEFSEVGGVGRESLAVIDASTGSVGTWRAGTAFGCPAAYGATAYLPLVGGIAPVGDTVFVSGFFDSPIGVGGGLAAFDTVSGVLLPLNVNLSGLCNTQMAQTEPAISPLPIGRSGESLYAAYSSDYAEGFFGYQGVEAFSLATGQLQPWSQNLEDVLNGVDSSGNPMAGTVQSLVVVENIVYVGGAFTNIAGMARNSLAAIDATTGAILPWNPNANGPVTALIIQDGVVYVAGNFTSVGGATRYSLAKLDPTTGMVVQ